MVEASLDMIDAPVNKYKQIVMMPNTSLLRVRSAEVVEASLNMTDAFVKTNLPISDEAYHFCNSNNLDVGVQMCTMLTLHR